MNWGGNFQQHDPPHFYTGPPVDRNTAIANATRQYNELTGHHQAPAPAAAHPHQNAPAHQHNAPPAQHPAAATSAQLSPSLDEASHPDHALFQQAYAGVKRLDAEHGRVPDQHSENLAGALTVEAKSQGLKRIDIVALSDDGSKVFAAQHAVFGTLTNVASVDTVKAVHSPIEQSTLQMVQANQTFLQNQQQTQQLAQQVSRQAQVTQNGPHMG